jgi:uncharacterized protein
VKLSQPRIAGLATLIVERLINGRMLEPVRDRKSLVSSLERVISDELAVEDRINIEAKQLLRKYEAQIEAGRLNEHQLFQMIKKQLVKQKGAVL